MKKTTTGKRPIRHATEDMAELPPMMEPAEAAAVWQTYHSARDAGDRDGAIAARNRIVEANLRLVPYTMGKHPSFVRRYTSPEDAYQVASIGLIRAVESFEPSKGFAFGNIAFINIRRALVRPFSAKNCVGRRRTAIVNRALNLFYSEHGRRPDEEELWGLTGLTAEQLRRAMAWRRIGGAASIDAPLSEAGDSHSLGEELTDKATVDPCSFIRTQEAGVFLRRILACLKPLYRKLLWLRFYAGWSLPALAELCDTSRQHIEQITSAAVKKLQRIYATAYRIWSGLDVPGGLRNV